MSGLIWIQPVCHSGGNSVGVFRILKENKQKTINPEKLRGKHQKYRVLANFFIYGVSSVCTTSTVMTIFVDNGDKGYLICNLWL